MDNIISKKDSSQGKALAILMVLISHLGQKYGINHLSYFGTFGVTLFLFLSGYGLTISYKKNGLKDYFKKRYNKVLFPYELITIIWIFFDVIGQKKYSTKIYLLSFLGIDYTRSIDPTMWYVTFIILWYVIFYIIFKLSKKDSTRFTILNLFGLFFLIFVKSGILKEIAEPFSLHSITFPIGVGIALYEERIRQYINIKSKILIIILISICYLIAKKVMILYLPTMCLDLISLVLIIYILKYFNFKTLNFIGKYSYYIYLVEGYLIFRTKILTYINISSISIILYLAITFIIAFALSKIVNIKNIFA